jgi:hypothetical protein
MKTIKIPFSFSNGGVTETADILEYTEQRIVDVLTTRTGERAINTNYGVGIQSLLYEMVDSLVFDDFKTEALVKLNEEVGSARVVDVSIGSQELIQAGYLEDSTVVITVVYSIPTYGTRSFSFNVTSDI